MQDEPSALPYWMRTLLSAWSRGEATAVATKAVTAVIEDATNPEKLADDAADETGGSAWKSDAVIIGIITVAATTFFVVWKMTELLTRALAIVRETVGFAARFVCAAIIFVAILNFLLSAEDASHLREGAVRFFNSTRKHLDVAGAFQRLWRMYSTEDVAD